MTVDILAVLAAVIFAAMGWRSGAVAQSLRVGAAVAAFLAASPVADIIQQILFPETDLSGPVVEALLMVGSGIGVYIVLAIAGWLFVRAMWAASDGLTLLDRTGGGVLGLLKATILVYFLVAAVAMIKEPLAEVDEKDVLHIQDSRMLAWVERYNVVVPWRFGDLQRLHQAMRVRAALDNPKIARTVRRHGSASDFLKSDKIRKLVDDGGLVEAAQSGAYYRTLADDRARAYLNDRRFVSRLRMVDWESLIEKIDRQTEEGSVDV